jgi:hypothetical protein
MTLATHEHGVCVQRPVAEPIHQLSPNIWVAVRFVLLYVVAPSSCSLQPDFVLFLVSLADIAGEGNEPSPLLDPLWYLWGAAAGVALFLLVKGVQASRRRERA